jgi:hypothetical protein
MQRIDPDIKVRRRMPSTGVILIALAVAVACVLLLRRPRAPALSGDAQVVAQLRQAGSDLSKPHVVEFFMYFPAEAGALNVARKVGEAGFTAEVKRAASGNLPWLTFATGSMVVTATEMERLRSMLTALCEPEHGEYDGWGAPVVK